MNHPIDKHVRAKRVADEITRELFGEDAVPCVPGSIAHECWLQHYCVAIRECEEK